MGLMNSTIEGVMWICINGILLGMTEGQCLHEKIQQCTSPLFALWNKDSPLDLLHFVQSFTSHKIETWCSILSGVWLSLCRRTSYLDKYLCVKKFIEIEQKMDLVAEKPSPKTRKMSHVEVCLTRLSDCTGDNEITIEVVLDVANYICHTRELGDIEKQRKCVFNEWNSATRSCYETFFRVGTGIEIQDTCNAIERYVDCTKDVTEERCGEKNTEWLEAITNYYILRQSQQFYQCNFDQKDDGHHLSFSVLLFAIFTPLIIIVLSITIYVIVRHKHNQKQIKKSMTTMSLVSQQSRDSQSNQVPSDDTHQRRKKEKMYVSVNANTTQEETQDIDDPTWILTEVHPCDKVNGTGHTDTQNDLHQKGVPYPTLPSS